MVYAKKSLGQNFLISPRVIGAIVSAGNIQADETILEVGPGKGVLTRALLDAGARVIAVEKDDRLIPLLSQTFKKEILEKKIELVHGNIMEMDADSLHISEHYKVIANIPYYITGALIRNFLSARNKPSDCILMVQKEVADRIIARGGKESLLSLSVKVYAAPELVMNVSRGNFFPVPNVDSAVIKLSGIKNQFETKTDEERFFEITKAGFAQKRKKLISNLEKVIPKEKLVEIFEKMELDKNVRAEDLSLEQWLAILKHQ